MAAHGSLDDLRYIFAFLSRYIYRAADGQMYIANDTLLQKNNRRLLYELNTRDDLPDRYRVIGELMLDEGRNLTSLRLVEILPENVAD